MIGHSLDAAVTIGLSEALYHKLKPYESDLRSIFIVSEAHMVQGTDMPDAYVSQEVEDIAVQVGSGPVEKCSRCWVHDTTVGQQPGHPGICSRCYDSLKIMGAV